MGDRPGTLHPPASGGGRRVTGGDYRIRAADDLGGGSLKEKCRANFAAIELLQRLQAERRPATPEEQRILIRYVGWGGLPQVFATHNDPAWQPQRERLRELLSPEEIRAAQSSTLNAHYTSPTVISAIYDGVQRLGFTHGRILEPALGIGHFFGLMPDEMRVDSSLSGVELDPTSAAIARALYPGTQINEQGFEQTNFPEGRFDLAISNVPFGNYTVFDPALMEDHRAARLAVINEWNALRTAESNEQDRRARHNRIVEEFHAGKTVDLDPTRKSLEEAEENTKEKWKT